MFVATIKKIAIKTFVTFHPFNCIEELQLKIMLKENAPKKTDEVIEQGGQSKFKKHVRQNLTKEEKKIMINNNTRFFWECPWGSILIL